MFFSRGVCSPLQDLTDRMQVVGYSLSLERTERKDTAVETIKALLGSDTNPPANAIVAAVKPVSGVLRTKPVNIAAQFSSIEECSAYVLHSSPLWHSRTISQLA